MTPRVRRRSRSATGLAGDLSVVRVPGQRFVDQCVDHHEVVAPPAQAASSAHADVDVARTFLPPLQQPCLRDTPAAAPRYGARHALAA